MKNLNAEAVMSELRKNDSCYVEDIKAIQNAIALISSQEQKINELTEENERLKSVEFTCGFVKPHKVLECPIFDEIERTKTDTVRKMKERLIAEFRKDDRMNYYLRKTLDQIAKELEGECL